MKIKSIKVKLIAFIGLLILVMNVGLGIKYSN